MTDAKKPWIAGAISLAMLPGFLGILLGVPAAIGQSSEQTTAHPPGKTLFDFKDSDVKFSVQTLMNILRDNRHEGWVLAAYPDPKTSRPLIGAGFSLDVAATEHPQTDPLNENLFLEPSSAELWQAAGLEPERLQRILERFNRDLESWTKKRYRRKVMQHSLAPELTEEEAMRLLRISAIEAIHNARAYCRNFDELSGPQQLALSQLVFQMGVNLEGFVEFLSALNGDTSYRDLSMPDGVRATDAETWRLVQRTLVESQWARRYTTRAQTVIAMFDPDYARDPGRAIRLVNAMLPPPVEKHRRRRPPVHALRAGVDGGHSGSPPGKKSRIERKRQVT
ncbi:hypothetical protein ACPOL_5706 [Acidisarcina polymorpha]|uniref:Uncharacterized protein n=1 Tax=Acidisarcina polymorpha TaxID=2211140 RepID=A0A2Z5G6S9_9BACT|nr:hypothetical protein [Acidisarcina polymorpha]AXC14952.1 hypothetical protein ACPOL_5706 [Acidisarcina polymorpha]